MLISVPVRYLAQRRRKLARRFSMTSNAELQTAAYADRDEQVQVLLVEDDDGDAVLVGELLREVGAAVVVQRARSLTQAKDLVPGAACVLLDLGLPDSQG